MEKSGSINNNDMKKIDFLVKQRLIQLSGSCFWLWSSYYTFLSSCGVPSRLISRYPRTVYSKYDVMRNILNDLENDQNLDVIESIISNFYKLDSAVDDNDSLDPEKAKRFLSEFKELIGNDPIDKAIQKKANEENRKRALEKNEEMKAYREVLEQIKRDFFELTKDDPEFSPQQRGFELEKLFYRLIELEEFEFTKPYKTKGEQIDGHFRYEKFDYLVEIKWIQSQIRQDDLAIFDRKIQGKAQSTRGLFFAVNGFDENGIQKFSGNSPRIVLMDVQDFIKILEGRITFFDCLKTKVAGLVRHGDIFCSL